MNQLTYNHDYNPFGSTIPLDVKFASQLLSSMEDNVDSNSNACFDLISESNLSYLSRMCYDYVTIKSFSRLKYLRIRKSIIEEWQTNDSIKQLNLSVKDFDSVYAGLLIICECIGRHFPKSYCSKNIENLRESIIKHSKMPEPIINLLFNRFLSSNSKPNILPFIQWDWIATGDHLISMHWQLHLAISDCLTSKIMEPFVRFEFIYGSLVSTTDCESKQQKRIVFECRIKQFHQLRFIVALLLKEMSKIESNEIQ